jgi:hypothetical protein
MQKKRCQKAGWLTLFVLFLSYITFFGITSFGIIFCGPAQLCSANDEILITETVICKRCKKSIHGRFVKINGMSYHRPCFVCERCEKPLGGLYKAHRGAIFHPDCYKEEMGLVCVQCKKLLSDKWSVYDNGKYHKRCLEKHIKLIQPKCMICGLGIEGKYVSSGSGTYHINCYKENKLTKCCICSKYIEGKYIEDPWSNRSHIHHDSTQVSSCSSCMRIISETTSMGGFKYEDGRTICGYCKQTVVKKSYEISRCRETVIDYLLSVGVKGIPSNIPVQLVSKKDLKKKSKARHPADTKGCTQLIASHKRHKQVFLDQTVYILSGMPKLEFKGVLAHELLHVWLNQQDIKMSGSKMEGFCNLGTMLVYKNNGSKHAKVLLEGMEKNSDPEYGRGYRRMKKKLENLGWDGLLKNIK